METVQVDWDREQVEMAFVKGRLVIEDLGEWDDIIEWEAEVGTSAELLERVLLPDARWVRRLSAPEDVVEFFTSPTMQSMGSLVYSGPRKLRLYEESLEELSGDTDGFDSVVPGLAYRGLKTLVVGLSKAGKSFTVWAHLGEAVRNGTKVKYLSEESKDTVFDKVKTFGLTDDLGGLFHLTRRGHEQVRGMKWTEVVNGLADETRTEKYDVVVIDTLRPWLGLEEGQSDSADVMGKAIDALSAVTEAGAAVMVIHQSPWEGQRARGSTEIHAASDLIFHIKGEGFGPREVKYIGGRVEQKDIEETRVIRWTGTEMENLGKMRSDKATKAIAVLNVIEKAKHPLTLEELSEGSELSERSLRRYLPQLEEQHLVLKMPGEFTPGKGREPDRWQRPNVFGDLLRELEGSEVA